jgi:hypothetical protein
LSLLVVPFLLLDREIATFSSIAAFGVVLAVFAGTTSCTSPFASALLLVQLDRRSRRFANFSAMLAVPTFSHSHHSNENGQNEENSMTIIEAAFVVNAIARLVTALASLITMTRSRRRP